VEGDYKVGLEVWGTDGFHANYSTVITVHPKPQARFEISPEKPDLMDEEVLFLNYSTGSEKYNWSFGDGSVSSLFEPRHKYSKFGNYNVRLIATSQFGCSDTLNYINAFTDRSTLLCFQMLLFLILMDQQAATIHQKVMKRHLFSILILRCFRIPVKNFHKGRTAHF